MKSTVAGVEEILNTSYESFEEMFKAIRLLASQSASDREQLGNFLDSQKSPEGDKLLKLAVIAYLLERYDQSIALLKSASEGKEKRWLVALMYKSMRDYPKALENLERARARGWNDAEVLSEMVEVNRLAGDMTAAQKTLNELKQKAGDSVYYLYQAGMMADINGDPESAIDLLQKAVDKDPDFTPALFRLAFINDLNGCEDRALELYRLCIKQSPIYISAMINLAVLYEDDGKYAQAAELLRRILEVYPNNQRAKLFLRDVESSLSMFYDEEYERKRDKFQQVLDMPISDFELSVRSRNCLKKMGIRTLGDLTRITEAELLSYKNFGETSLNEIKAIMTSKGLRLGQAVEDKASKKAAAILPGGGAVSPVTTADQALLSKSIEDLQLSVRSKKCLQKLNVVTIGDLVNYSESELMSVKNFGSISLKEVKEKLTSMNLSLRHSEL